MILAAADYADGTVSEPSPEMKEALRTRRWGLPYQGGWMDQPAGMIERLQIMLNVYDSVRSWKRSKNWAKWAQSNPHYFKIVSYIMKLRSKRG